MLILYIYMCVYVYLYSFFQAKKKYLECGDMILLHNMELKDSKSNKTLMFRVGAQKGFENASGPSKLLFGEKKYI